MNSYIKNLTAGGVPKLIAFCLIIISSFNLYAQQITNTDAEPDY